MLKRSVKHGDRIKIDDHNIFIDNQGDNIGESVEVNKVFSFRVAIPTIDIFENYQLVRRYHIEPLTRNPNLKGQFLHSSIRILASSAVMIDGIISKSKALCPKWTDSDYEAVRLQPFYLSNAHDLNMQLVGKGLFERGLHFNGTITPSSVRNVCICDSCVQSFTVQHFHAGFSEVQYFYSSDSKETLVIPYSAIENLPTQLQTNVDDKDLLIIESKLPPPSSGEGSFKFYNPLRCPHCFAAYIDFETYKEIRTGEYYGNIHVNDSVLQF